MTEAALVLSIGTGIKRVMNQKHITRRELSNRTGIRPENISRYCRGVIYPSARNLVAILNGLNTTLHEITRPAE